MKNSILLIMVSGILFSCTTPQLIQHTGTLPNSGNHTAANELVAKLTAGISRNISNSNRNNTKDGPYEKNIQLQPQISYSLTNRWSVQSAFMYSNEKAGRYDSDNNKVLVYKHRRTAVDAGVGYYINLNKKRTVFAELVVGGGAGKYKTTEEPTVVLVGGRFYSHNISKLFFQPSFYTNNKRIVFNIGTRFSFYNFEKISTDYQQQEKVSRSLPAVDNASASTFDLFIKTEYFFRGAPWFGINVNINLTNEISKTFNENYSSSYVGAGITLRTGNN